MVDSGLISRWQEIKQRIRDIAQDAGRDPDQVQLLAVSKGHSAGSIQSLASQGQQDFGESYAQEALEKIDSLQLPGVRWHFIGRLQSNKAKYLAGRFTLIHSLDRPKLAQALHERCQGLKKNQDILIQVNIASDKTKAGVLPGELPEFAAGLEQYKRLRLQGLMCMPPFYQDPEQAREDFAALRRLKLWLEERLGQRLPHLSMGMSNDYQQAIQEGATLIRIGTRIFGPRKYNT
ncbi:MAG: YggS family pyridoxal phosphate-dependent enzyme [Thermodesulfobacteriota bacterium]